MWLLKIIVLICLMLHILIYINVNFCSARYGEDEYEISGKQYIIHFMSLFIWICIACLLFIDSLALSINAAIIIFSVLWIAYLIIYKIFWRWASPFNEIVIVKRMNAIFFLCFGPYL